MTDIGKSPDQGRPEPTVDTEAIFSGAISYIVMAREMLWAILYEANDDEVEELAEQLGDIEGRIRERMKRDQ